MIINIQDDILKLHAMGLLNRLLKDKATKGNILWATDAYSHHGEFYSSGNEIRSNRITGDNSDLIKTRARRVMEQRTERTRQHAEVFTPLWIIKKMNDFVDEQWFGRKKGFYCFNKEGKVRFSKEKHWKLYVDSRRMEITCGEAPFLATRYDVETGEAIPIEDRIGLLDRKLRIVTENTNNIEEWKEWALRAVQSIYGYELQGDSLLIARVNILFTVEEHMFRHWRQRPDKDWMGKLCNVISWNIWQMDGLKGCVPVPPKPTEEQLSLFEPVYQHIEMDLFGEITEIDIPCRLFDWRGDRSISYEALQKKGSELMKFDYIIGNPPYQEESSGDSTGTNPIYHLFFDGAISIGDTVELITPARFLFNAGKTPKAWNEKMLSDRHLSILKYEQDPNKVFPGVPITGGVAVSYWNAKDDHEPIGTFIPYDELRSIVSKVTSRADFKSLREIIFVHSKFALENVFALDAKYQELIGSDGKDRRVRANALEKFDFFTENRTAITDIRVLGLVNNKRAYKYIPASLLEKAEWEQKYKVFVPESNGASGMLGEVAARIISKPVVGAPGEGVTQTFIVIGAFDTLLEAENLYKYILSKFTRVLLGALKATQRNNSVTWAHVPLQDFTSSSDIDWSKSITEIDKQLYKKYELDEAEISFIEDHLKEMS